MMSARAMTETAFADASPNRRVYSASGACVRRPRPRASTPPPSIYRNTARCVFHGASGNTRTQSSDPCRSIFNTIRPFGFGGDMGFAARFVTLRENAQQPSTDSFAHHGRTAQAAGACNRPRRAQAQSQAHVGRRARWTSQLCVCRGCTHASYGPAGSTPPPPRFFRRQGSAHVAGPAHARDAGWPGAERDGAVSVSVSECVWAPPVARLTASPACVQSRGEPRRALDCRGPACAPAPESWRLHGASFRCCDGRHARRRR
jgi:hypothetical protein